MIKLVSRKRETIGNLAFVVALITYDVSNENYTNSPLVFFIITARYAKGRAGENLTRMIAMMLSFFLFCSYFVPSKMYLIRPNIQAKRELHEYCKVCQRARRREFNTDDCNDAFFLFVLFLFCP